MFYPKLLSKIVIIPTLVDLKIYPEPFNYNLVLNSNIIIGWIGSSGGLKYLIKIEEAIDKILKEFPMVTFKVVSNKPYVPILDFSVENIKWVIEDEIKYFFELDISIMPLDNSDRAKCKAGFKAIQSLAVGVPVVASNIGFNKKIIIHGKNGFLAESTDDFYRYLKMMVVDIELRNKMKKNSRQSIKKFDYSNWEKIYIKNIISN